MVTGVDEYGIDLTDVGGGTRRIESRTKVWAAGVAASPLAKHLANQLGLPVDRAGRVPVEDDWSLSGYPEVFVVGDMADTGLPGVAQVAIQGAQHAATLITERVSGREASRVFEYVDKGSMATIARFSAVASIGRLRLSGFTAWLIWLVIHLLYLIGFKQRLTTLLHWAISFLGRGRGERTITRQQLVARRALDRLPPRPIRASRPCTAPSPIVIRPGVIHPRVCRAVQRAGWSPRPPSRSGCDSHPIAGRARRLTLQAGNPQPSRSQVARWRTLLSIGCVWLSC